MNAPILGQPASDGEPRALAPRGLARGVARHPMWFIGGALGLGYVLGGGLRSALGVRLLRLGGVVAWRFMVLPAAERALHNLVQRGRD